MGVEGVLFFGFELFLVYRYATNIYKSHLGGGRASGVLAARGGGSGSPE